MREIFIKLCEWAEWLRACGLDPLIKVHIFKWWVKDFPFLAYLGMPIQIFSCSATLFLSSSRTFRMSTHKVSPEFKLDGIFVTLYVCTTLCKLVHCIRTKLMCDLCGFGYKSTENFHGCASQQLEFHVIGFKVFFFFGKRLSVKKTIYQKTRRTFSKMKMFVIG